jgi:hypothetical protein
VRGSESVTGNLSVTGSATVAGALSVTGALSVGGNEVRQLTAATSKSASGVSSVIFNDIPSWVKRVTIMFHNITFNSAFDNIVQLGTGTSASPTIIASGYNGGASRLSSSGTNGTNRTDGFIVKTDNVSSVLSGNMVITKLTGNTWVASAVFGLSANTYTSISGGSIALANPLTQVQFASGASTFTGGSVNIMYE